MFAQANGGAIVNAWWHLKRNVLAFTLRAAAVTNGADFFWYFAAALTLRANSGLLDVAKDRARHANHLATTLTSWASFQVVPRLHRRALTVFTGIFQV